MKGQPGPMTTSSSNAPTAHGQRRDLRPTTVACGATATFTSGHSAYRRLRYLQFAPRTMDRCSYSPLSTEAILQAPSSVRAYKVVIGLACRGTTMRGGVCAVYVMKRAGVWDELFPWSIYASRAFRAKYNHGHSGASISLRTLLERRYCRRP